MIVYLPFFLPTFPPSAFYFLSFLPSILPSWVRNLELNRCQNIGRLDCKQKVILNFGFYRSSTLRML